MKGIKGKPKPKIPLKKQMRFIGCSPSKYMLLKVTPTGKSATIVNEGRSSSELLKKIIPGLKRTREHTRLIVVKTVDCYTKVLNKA